MQAIGKSHLLKCASRVLAKGLLLFVLAGPEWGEARKVRVATFNVENGVGAPQTPKYQAIREIIRRIDADVVAFQELTPGSLAAWKAMARDLGYPHTAQSSIGPYSGDLFVGYFSRFPIIEQNEVRSPEGAQEIGRWPLRVTIEVPGAARPFVLWTVHHKAMFGYADCFRRAVEARRIRENVTTLLTSHTNYIEYVILGDMNDDFEREDQPVTYSSLPRRLPATYRLGSDVTLPMAYRVFPMDHYKNAGVGMRWVPAYRAGTKNRKTHLYTDFTLDYIFASTPIWSHPDGPPQGEIYHSQNDGPNTGLPKQGNPLPADTSLAASDHYPVFADLYLEDAAP